MTSHLLTTNEDATDALYATSASHLAELFGARTKAQIRSGAEVYESARLAGSFAEQVIAQRPKVIGRIDPAFSWGVSQ